MGTTHTHTHHTHTHTHVLLAVLTPPRMPACCTASRYASSCRQPDKVSRRETCHRHRFPPPCRAVPRAVPARCSLSCHRSPQQGGDGRQGRWVVGGVGGGREGERGGSVSVMRYIYTIFRLSGTSAVKLTHTLRHSHTHTHTHMLTLTRS